jgi:hypothetical protein
MAIIPFIRSIVFFLIGAVILHGLAIVASTVSPDGTTSFLQIDQNNLEEVLANKNSIEAIVLGNSHGDDIDFSVMNYNGYSLARAWGDLYEIQYYLNYLVPRLPELEVVFIPVSYFSLDWDNTKIEDISLRRIQIYETIPSWIPISGDIKHYLIGKSTQLLPIKLILREDNWKGIFQALLSTELEQINQPLSTLCEYPQIEVLVQISQSRANEQIEFAWEVQHNHPEIREDTHQILKEIISYLNEYEIKLVMFTPPYYEVYSQYFIKHAPDLIENLAETMAMLKADYSVRYYDYSVDERFKSNHTLFVDADHLNSCGKKLFSTLLSEDINNFTENPNVKIIVTRPR